MCVLEQKKSIFYSSIIEKIYYLPCFQMDYHVQIEKTQIIDYNKTCTFNYTHGKKIRINWGIG